MFFVINFIYLFSLTECFQCFLPNICICRKPIYLIQQSANYFAINFVVIKFNMHSINLLSHPHAAWLIILKMG